MKSEIMSELDSKIDAIENKSSERQQVIFKQEDENLL